MTGIVAKIVGVHTALDAAALPHAFGGALALAWCTQQARGTIDIDVNIFVGVDRLASVVTALADIAPCTSAQRDQLERDGQVRLHWDTTPLDVFLNTTDFHRQAALRCRVEPFAGVDVPFLSCGDLAVFKAFFNRTKDWADLEAMHAAGTLDVDRVIGVLVRHLGPDDERVGRVLALVEDGSR
jgi:hypothetical protein